MRTKIFPTSTVFILTSALALFIFLSCQKEINGDVPIVNTSELITVEGIITDEQGIPLQNVRVQAGFKQGQTDINGSFRITDAGFSTSEKFVTASKAGYFLGSRTFFARQGGNNFLRIQLLQKNEVASINATTGGTATISTTNIDFPANAFVNVDGSIYAGLVSVKAAYLNPTSPNLNQQMPGDLRGIRSTGEMRGLKSFGMVKVELEGASGQQLKLKTGITAKITMPIPPLLLNQAGSTIPMWYFDETVGLWKEEGSAQKSGNNYVTNVSHFTWWNVDDPFAFVRLSMRIVSPAQQGIAGLKVVLTSVSDSTHMYDYSDIDGYIDAFVPINVAIRREIFNDCDSLLGSDVIGPFAVNTNSGNMILTSALHLQTISGTVVNCNNAPVTDGYVQISMPGRSVFANISNGNFTTTFVNCHLGGTASIIAVDQSTLKQSSVLNVTLTGVTVATGVIQACGPAVAEFITITIDGVTRTYNPPLYKMTGGETDTATAGFFNSAMIAWDSIADSHLQLFFERASSGTTVPMPLNKVRFYLNEAPGAPSLFRRGTYWEINLTNPAVYTQHGPVGQVLAGQFGGTFYIMNTFPVDTVTVSVNFQLKRKPY